MNSPRTQVVEKLNALVQREFGGDRRRAFDHYDRDRSGTVSVAELTDLLVDAKVGSSLTRVHWAEGIVAVLDTDLDGEISFQELLHVL